MIFNFIRLLMLMVLIIVIFIDIPISPTFAIQTNQLLIAIFIILIIIVVDEIIGFLLGVIFLVIYFKYYQKIINNKSSTTSSKPEEQSVKAFNPFSMDNYNFLNGIDSFSSDIKPPITNGNLNEKIKDHYINIDKENNTYEMPYISNELLSDAQNNIYDEKNYYTEIKTDNNTYGIQGLNSDDIHYMAFDKTSIENNYK